MGTVLWIERERMRSATVIVAALALVAASSACGSSSDTQVAADSGSGPAPDPQADCFDVRCLSCGMTDDCNPSATSIDGTCCELGDSLVQRGQGAGAEIVDVESDGTYAIACGGFGAAVSDITNPDDPVTAGGGSERCQNSTFGAVLPGERRIFYLAHHGDSWVEQPTLSTHSLGPDGALEVDTIRDPEVLFEGLAWRDGYLYVTAHGGGLRVYRTDEMGVPTYLGSVDGFDNAVEIELGEDTAYVVDRVSGLHVLALDDPAMPVRVQTLQNNGTPRDLTIDSNRVFVALGAAGVDVFDASDPRVLAPITNAAGLGSVQAVSADGGLLGLASWDHVALRDASTLQLLGTEQTRGWPEFEQNLAVSLKDGFLYVGEWEALHVLQYVAGVAAPDIWIEREIVSFPPTETSSQVVPVRNRGMVPLEITNIRASEAAFTVDATEMTIEPGAARAFEVSFTPPAPPTGEAVLELITNDPDPEHNPMRLPLVAAESPQISVGEPLTEEFGFLDLEGTGQVAGLEGKVIVLAYFALF